MKNDFSHRFHRAIFIVATLVFGWMPAGRAGIVIEAEDPQFHSQIEKELQFMRDGKRGIVSQSLIMRLDVSPSTTTIRPLTSEEETWHPNDRRGTRGHVVALDTKIRGAERNTPTAAVIYLHPNRIDPNLSLFRLGTLAYELSMAADLNFGQFSPDFQAREKRAVFFRNAWCDSLGYNLIEISGRVPTPEYQKAKKEGLIVPENMQFFPILDLEEFVSRKESETGGN